jgi:uncharacterized protein YkwD
MILPEAAVNAWLNSPSHNKLVVYILIWNFNENAATGKKYYQHFFAKI